MRAIHTDLAYTKDALTRWQGEEWAMVADSVSTKLSRATVMLQGQLDAMVMCETESPSAGVTFSRAVFADSELAGVQANLKRLESRATADQIVWADFCTIANFWKHYIPYQPLPVMFHSGEVDFQAVIGQDESGGEIKSGPLLGDLLVPTYEGARVMLMRLARLYGVDVADVPPSL